MLTQIRLQASLRSLLWFLQSHLTAREHALLSPQKIFKLKHSLSHTLSPTLTPISSPTLSDVLAVLPLQNSRKNQLELEFQRNFQTELQKEREPTSGQCVQKELTCDQILVRTEIEQIIGRTLPDLFPLALRYRGNPEILRKPKVAIVGSRHATYYGRQQGHLFATALAKAGCCIVSGGAIGIDSIANARALDSGASCAVIGSGVNKLYPSSNIPLFHDLSRSPQGLLLSEFPDDQSPARWNFPRRNQTIAALADFLLVVEAHLTSGSLITANAALDFGVDVGALPGPVDSVTSSGTNALIKAGAYVIETPNDVLDRLANMVQLSTLNIQRDKLCRRKTS